MSRKLMFAVACAAILVLGMADGGKRDDSAVPTVQESRVNSLKGLVAVYLLIEPLTSVARNFGLSTSQLQTDIELRLRSAGIAVLTVEQGSKAPGNPHLKLSVVCLKSKTGLSVFSTRLALIQNVLPSRNPTQLLLASTWSVVKLGYTAGNGAFAIRETVKDSADQFCNDYLTGNQKDPSGKFIPFDFKYAGPLKACERWGKPENYVSQLLVDYNKMRVHFSREEVSHAAMQACKERVTNEKDLADCRGCVGEIITALYKGKEGL